MRPTRAEGPPMRNAKVASLLAVSTSLALLALTGCATLSPDSGIDTVETLARDRLGNRLTLPRTGTTTTAITATSTRDPLAKPLTVENAVEIALANNAGLKSSLTELGI